MKFSVDTTEKKITFTGPTTIEDVVKAMEIPFVDDSWAIEVDFGYHFIGGTSMGQPISQTNYHTFPTTDTTLDD